MTERILTDVVDHVATVMLNRPEKHNAVDMEMFEALIETGERLATDRTVRAVVLAGEGEHFCAGIDISVFQGVGIGAAGEGRMDPRESSPANVFQSAAYIWREMPVPVIAAIHGVAFGAGLQIALGADIRYASADAKLSVMEIKWGIMPDMAISATAQGVVPIDRLKELAYTGRVISGGEALAKGLVTAVKDDPLQAAQQLARDIAGRSPQAIRAIKTLFDESWHADAAGFLQREARLQSALMGSPNQIEAVTANMEKRAADFADV